MRVKASFFSLLLLTACIGVDHLDDPIVDELIIITPDQVALEIDESTSLMATYYNEYGIEQTVELSWGSSNSEVASVDANGNVLAIAAGQALITASYQSIASTSIQVVVVADLEQVASVEITAPKNVLSIGETIQLTATPKNIVGTTLDDKTILWFSSHPDVVSIDGMGNAESLANGSSTIYAQVEGVKSNNIEIVSGDTRTGTFSSAGGYKATGTATLSLEDGTLTLDLSENFETSFALGTYIYLSNSTSGGETLGNGVEISVVTTNGAHSFDVSAIDPTIGLYDYRYVIILCKPAAITFGLADLDL